MGAIVLVVASLGWSLYCQPPKRILRAALVLGLMLFSPYFLLIPVMAEQLSLSAFSAAARVVAGIFAHGMAGMVVSITTVTSLTVSDLREGLLRLPVPSLVAVIVLQIVHQSLVLVEETRRIASAMSVRGACGRGMTAFRVLVSLPQVWLPRVIQRAERVAAAMDVRGYCAQDLPSFENHRVGTRDGGVVVMGMGFLILAIMIRIQ
jgi:energy-coupling factor transporter transmembrane protein EcfT